MPLLASATQYTFGKCTVGGAYLCPIWIIIEDNVGNDNGLGAYL